MFKGKKLHDLKFYYQDNIDKGTYPTFIHWMIDLRSKGEY